MIATDTAQPSSTAKVRVLVVDDDPDIVDLLTFALQREYMEPLAARDANTALQLFAEHQPDLIVLDIKLDGPSGLEVLTSLRQQSQVPVIMLTAFDAEEDKVRGLKLGADDYMTKPFGFRELIERINALMRRTAYARVPAPAPERWLQVGSLRLDRHEQRVTKSGRHVKLTPTEFRFLQELMLRADTLVPYTTLLKEVWGGYGKSVRVTLQRLREKLEDDPSCPTLLITIPGVGVRLRPEPPPV